MQFNSIIGQNEVKSRLIKTVKENRISHAQFFSGPGGSGKLATAIAYAQYISCKDATELDSCGTCPSCIKFQKLEHPDLHFVFPIVKTEKQKSCDEFLKEWRAAVLKNPYLSLEQWYNTIDIGNKQASISVEDSLHIIKKLSLKSYESEYKFMIIWKPEKLHHQAIPKLLKILEEPPDKTLFVLVTENYEQLLPTILSRTQLVKFPKVSADNITAFLNEKGVENSKISEIITLSDGNINRALELSQNADQKDNSHLFDNWITSCLKKDIVSLMNWTEETAKLGREKQKQFIDYSLEQFRKNLLLNLGVKGLVISTFDNQSPSNNLSKYINLESCNSIMETLNAASFHIERNGSPKIIFLDTSLKISRLFVN